MSMLFAILAVFAGTLGTWFFGLYGLFTTLGLSAISIIFIIRKKKKSNEITIVPAIFLFMGLLFSGFLTAALFYVSAQVKTDAEKFGGTKVIKYADDFKYGTYTVILNAEKDGVDAETLTKELEAISK